MVKISSLAPREVSLKSITKIYPDRHTRKRVNKKMVKIRLIKFYYNLVKLSCILVFESLLLEASPFFLHSNELYMILRAVNRMLESFSCVVNIFLMHSAFFQRFFSTAFCNFSQMKNLLGLSSVYCFIVCLMFNVTVL